MGGVENRQEPIVAVRGVHTRAGDAAILHGIDLEVRRGEVVAVIGPSGSGKSTLLRAINYLTPFAAGEVEVDGVVLRPGLSERRDAALLRSVRLRAGMVFQSLNLFPHRTVLENVVEAPLRVLRLSRGEAEERARRLLARVGMWEHAAAYPPRLSGGQQQRVAIARAMAMEPALLLMDEPTSALDPGLVGEVLSVISDLAAGGQAMLIVTHLVSFVRRVAHRVVVLADGRVVEEGPTARVLDQPAAAVTRGMLSLEESETSRGHGVMRS